MIKEIVRNHIFIFLIVALTVASHVASAQYTKRFDFSSESNGAYPTGSLISDGVFLYGTAPYGGIYDRGTVFKVKPDGTGYSTILDFNYITGSNPTGTLFFDGTFLYGMTAYGGQNSVGNIYKIKPDGTDFTMLYSFGFPSPYSPVGALISDGTFLYGMTYGGGLYNGGAVFRIGPDGTNYSTLLNFNDTLTGKNPRGSLIYYGSVLYGMTSSGGANNMGVVFKINPDGTGFNKLLDFDGLLNGRESAGSLITDGTFLYGMTISGGVYDAGVIFKIKTDGTGYTKLLDFTDASNGGYPFGSLITDGTFLYGMTYSGGASDAGVIFKIKPDGTEYLNILNFALGSDGRSPQGELTTDGTFLYGMTYNGGKYNDGIIFKIKPDGTEASKILDFVGHAKGSKPVGSLVKLGNLLFGMTMESGANSKGTIFSIGAYGEVQHTKFVNFEGGTNGSHPTGSLVSDGIFLYGMTPLGGINNNGIVFRVGDQGFFVKLHDFGQAPPLGEDGRNPNGSLILDSTYLYGMTWKGGANDLGTVFRIKRIGIENDYSTLYDFSGTEDGRHPYGSLTLKDSSIYGMTSAGGMYDDGVIFKLKSDGTEFLKIHDFLSTESGSNPTGSLVSLDSFLYGMTQYGGLNNEGVIFKIKPDGSSYTKLFDFSGIEAGRYPSGSLIVHNGLLYGMTEFGGASDNGVVFKINPDGTEYVKLFDFIGSESGSAPKGDLFVYGGFLFGVTYGGGTFDDGTVFRVDPTSVDIAENSAINSFKVFPNPGSGLFTIETIENAGNNSIYTIEVNNILGETLYSYAYPQSSGGSYSRKIIDVSNQSAGIYFISIKTEKGISVQKIIIQ